MTKINRKFSIILLVLSFVIVMFGVQQTFAWLSKGAQYETHLDFGSFRVTISATNADNPLAMNKGVYSLNGLSKNNSDIAYNKLQESGKTYTENNAYMENFKMTITMNADISGYMRVKLLDQWVVKRTYLNFDKTNIESVFRSGSEVFPFTLAEGWVYDSESNYCYYSKLIDKDTKDLPIPFITAGISFLPTASSYFVETCDVTFGTSVQVVQANRFEEIWGIPAIPQSTPSNGNGGK